MTDLLVRLNYKGQQRIAIINAEDNFINSLGEKLQEVKVDRKIDPRFPYGFVIIFVKSIAEVENITPVVIHNLMADGILWFCYPKKSSKEHKSDLDRDHGWKILNTYGFHGIRMVSIDENWSAMRFRNVKYIKSTNERYSQ